MLTRFGSLPLLVLTVSCVGYLPTQSEESQSALNGPELRTCDDYAGGETRYATLAAGYYELTTQTGGTFQMSLWYEQQGSLAGVVLRQCIGNGCIKYGARFEVEGTKKTTKGTGVVILQHHEDPLWYDDDGTAFLPLSDLTRALYLSYDRKDSQWKLSCHSESKGPGVLCDDKTVKMKHAGPNTVANSADCPKVISLRECTGTIQIESKWNDCRARVTCGVVGTCVHHGVPLCLGQQEYFCDQANAGGENSNGGENSGPGEASCNVAEALNTCDLSLKFNPRCNCSVNMQTCSCGCSCSGL